jgi:hypothetical protein
VNILEETLPFRLNDKSRGLERERKNPKHRNYDHVDSTRLVQTLLKYVLSIELEDVGS